MFFRIYLIALLGLSAAAPTPTLSLSDGSLVMGEQTLNIKKMFKHEDPTVKSSQHASTPDDETWKEKLAKREASTSASAKTPPSGGFLDTPLTGSPQGDAMAKAILTEFEESRVQPWMSHKRPVGLEHWVQPGEEASQLQARDGTPHPMVRHSSTTHGTSDKNDSSGKEEDDDDADFEDAEDLEDSEDDDDFGDSKSPQSKHRTVSGSKNDRKPKSKRDVDFGRPVIYHKHRLMFLRPGKVVQPASVNRTNSKGGADKLKGPISGHRMGGYRPINPSMPSENDKIHKLAQSPHKIVIHGEGI